MNVLKRKIRKNNVYPCKPQFYFIKVKFEVLNYMAYLHDVIQMRALQVIYFKALF